jgi:mannose-1-phosphate guanylyltransferase
MYAVVFAGGVGQRLWPLSRKNTSKQFSPLLGDKSSFQLAVERLQKVLPPENIYVSTNALYADALQSQARNIPAANFILDL